jgi:cytochrome oxidase assembly protein ShyY1
MAADPHHREPESFQWQPNWKSLAFVAVFLPLTIALGLWQLDRADQKRELQSSFRARQAAPPAPLSELPGAERDTYTRVSARGQYDNDHNILLDNRIRRGRPGYEVVTPLRMVTGEWVLVNRGWIAGGLDRGTLPDIPRIPGTVTVTGLLYRSPGEPFSLGEEHWRERWPQVIQNLEFGTIAEKLGRDLPGFTVRLAPRAPGALETGWPTINVQPEKHTAYAVQWFALALALLVLGIFANSNLGRWLRRSAVE